MLHYSLLSHPRMDVSKFVDLIARLVSHGSYWFNPVSRLLCQSFWVPVHCTLLQSILVVRSYFSLVTFQNTFWLFIFFQILTCRTSLDSACEMVWPFGHSLLHLHFKDFPYLGPILQSSWQLKRTLSLFIYLFASATTWECCDLNYIILPQPPLGNAVILIILFYPSHHLGMLWYLLLRESLLALKLCVDFVKGVSYCIYVTSDC